MADVIVPTAPDSPIPVDPHVQRYEETVGAILDLASTTEHGLDDPLLKEWMDQNEAEYQKAKSELEGIARVSGVIVEKVPEEVVNEQPELHVSGPIETETEEPENRTATPQRPKETRIVDGQTFTVQKLPTSGNGSRNRPFSRRHNRVTLSGGAFKNPHGKPRNK